MRAIIFDFDGTIADSFDYVADFLMKRSKSPPLSAKRKQELRGLSMTAMARRLGYGWWRLPFLLVRGRRNMRGVITKVQPFAGMPAVIRQLHDERQKLYIVSSNSQRNIRTFIRHYDLHDCFLGVAGNVGMFSKAGALRQLLKKNNLRPEEAVYIGDELRDIQAARSIGLPVIAVAWGFAHTADLEALRPAGVARKPADIPQIIKKL